MGSRVSDTEARAGARSPVRPWAVESDLRVRRRPGCRLTERCGRAGRGAPAPGRSRRQSAPRRCDGSGRERKAPWSRHDRLGRDRDRPRRARLAVQASRWRRPRQARRRRPRPKGSPPASVSPMSRSTRSSPAAYVRSPGPAICYRVRLRHPKSPRQGESATAAGSCGDRSQQGRSTSSQYQTVARHRQARLWKIALVSSSLKIARDTGSPIPDMANQVVCFGAGRR